MNLSIDVRQLLAFNLSVELIDLLPAFIDFSRRRLHPRCEVVILLLQVLDLRLKALTLDPHVVQVVLGLPYELLLVGVPLIECAHFLLEASFLGRKLATVVGVEIGLILRLVQLLLDIVATLLQRPAVVKQLRPLGL